MKTKSTEMHEGPDAFNRFREATRTIIGIPKSALPPRPARSKKKGTKRKA